MSTTAPVWTRHWTVGHVYRELDIDDETKDAIFEAGPFMGLTPMHIVWDKVSDDARNKLEVAFVLYDIQRS